MISTTRFDATGVNDVVAGVATVAAAAGWTVDLEEVGRVHIHGPSGHFEFYAISTRVIGIRHCTGFDGLQDPANQPGVYPETASYIYYSSINTSGDTNASWFIVGNAKGIWAVGWHIYGNYVKRRSIGVGAISDKIGSWLGGAFICGSRNNNDYNTSYYFFGSVNDIGMVIEGVWYPFRSSGGAYGTAQTHVVLRNEQPNYFNAGILPQPVMLCKKNDVDGTLLHPLGYVDGLLYIRPGDVYVQDDEFTIGADTYRCFPELQDFALKNE